MNEDVEFLDTDHVFGNDADTPKKKLVSPYGPKAPSPMVAFLLRTGFARTRTVATGIVVGTSIFFLSLTIVISINVLFYPSATYTPSELTVDSLQDLSTPNTSQNL